MNDALRKRLAALRATAQGRGATEAEAMAAAEKMAQIMREYGLTDDDVEYGEAEVPLHARRVTPRTKMLGVIAVCTNCAVTIKSDWTPCAIFIGRAPAPEIATYLTAVCDRAINRAIADFKTTTEYRKRRTLTTRRKAVEDFTHGMVDRLSVRLWQMFEDSRDDAARARANQVRDARMPDTTPTRLRKPKVRFGGAAHAGHGAAGRVQLAAGVNAGRAVQQIGRD